MSNQMSNGYVGTPALPRLQIPGLYINDEQVDGEIYIQWTPSASITRPQTSTVLIVAGPNARRPGLYPHDGLSNPQVQELTETQAEAFVPPEQGAITENFPDGAGEKEGPTKQYKRSGPKPGYKSKKAVAFTTAGYNDAPQPAVISKRRKRANENDESGDESMMLPTSTSLDVPKLDVIPTLTAAPISMPLVNSKNGDLAINEAISLSEASVEAVGKGLAKRVAKLSSKELEPTEKFENAIAKKPVTGPERKVTVDGMGRKRARDSRGHYTRN